MLLQVGALAARRAKEKAHDRRRRMSLDKAPHTLDQSSFTSLKESSMRAKRGTSPDFQTVLLCTASTSLFASYFLIQVTVILLYKGLQEWCISRDAVFLRAVVHSEELPE